MCHTKTLCFSGSKVWLPMKLKGQQNDKFMIRWASNALQPMSYNKGKQYFNSYQLCFLSIRKRSLHIFSCIHVRIKVKSTKSSNNLSLQVSQQFVFSLKWRCFSLKRLHMSFTVYRCVLIMSMCFKMITKYKTVNINWKINTNRVELTQIVASFPRFKESS